LDDDSSLISFWIDPKREGFGEPTDTSRPPTSQKGGDAEVEKTFREIARITHGAYARFDVGSADQLRDLLKAVGAFAAGGRAALEGKPGATLLLEQLK
jgi:hypothetical protein